MKKALALHYNLLQGHPFGQLSKPLLSSKDTLIEANDDIRPDALGELSKLSCLYPYKGFETNDKQLLKTLNDVKTTIPKESDSKSSDKKLPTFSGDRYVLAIDVNPAYGRKTITVMTIPVRIKNLSGNYNRFVFYPDTSSFPVINPELLEVEGNVPPHCIGKMENFDKFDYSVFKEPTEDLHELFTVSEAMFDKICDTTLGSMIHHKPLGLEGSDVTVTLRRVMADDSANQHIINLYRDLFTVSEDLLTGTSVCKTDLAYKDNVSVNSLADDYLINLLQSRKKPFLAHMDECTGTDTGDYRHRELFALDNTQRGAASVATLMVEGDVLAVNGPPGSGKTAMLKAIISHQYVEAALAKGDCPIVIGVGGTNQSVTNIVNAFPNVLYQGDSKTLLHMRRWIDGPANYGTYFPSTNVKNSMSPELMKSTVLGEIDKSNKGGVVRWVGKLGDLNNPSKLDQLINQFTNYCEQHYARTFSNLESCVEQIHHTLTACSQAINTLYYQLVEEFDKGFETPPSTHKTFSKLFDERHCNSQGAAQIETMYNLLHGDDTKKIQILSDVCREYLRDNGLEGDRQAILDNFGVLADMAKVILADRAVDLIVRSELFHYAARYWEGRYLLSCSEHFLIYASPSNLETALRRMCMITPILVSTVQSAPKIFAYQKPLGISEQTYLHGKADLLIIDEAGQADIRSTLPLLALAKKTIAVGDIAQIPPVIQDVTPLQEQGLFQTLGMGVNEADTKRCFVHAFKNQLLPSISGSILHVLRQISFCNHQGQGMSLRGHYRCQETLSQFCNELVYDNSIFIIPPLFKERGPFRPLTWVSSASETQKVGTSHKNEREARTIVEWLIDQWPRIHDHYNKPDKPKKRLPDLVGIISPYKKQSLVFVGRDEDDVGSKGKTQGMLHSLLLEKFKGTQYEITVDDIDKMKIGTVNALQGAEKPIILFSGTKSIKFGGDVHYRAAAYILNVAVSRAKECFVAFICEKTFGIPTTKEALSPPADPKSDSVGYLGYYIGKRGERLFPRSVVIIESDNKIKKLESLLGKRYIVVSTKGKILSLPFNDEEALAVKGGLHPKYQYNVKKNPKKKNNDKGNTARKAVSEILQLCGGADIDEIILATDDDNVGEHIAWHLQELFRQHQPSSLEKLQRVRLRGLSSEAVEKAFAVDNRESLNIARASAEMVRESLDLILGKKLSSIAQKCTPIEQGEDVQLALEKRLIQKVDETEIKGMGRVKAAILSLAYMHLKEQIASITHPTEAPVTVTVNGKKLRGRLVQQTPNSGSREVSESIEYIRNNAPFESIGSGWTVIESEFEERPVSPPDASTLNVMRQNAIKQQVKPVETYKALTGLYEGNDL
ncbi:toprim domain-containing protein [Vibrio owensii]|uniref:toprim domain-containing protein n=1 Tax=Vibrio owensii TaxID=696485 RepID=UPI0022DE106B|nr:toprim domain-containing protein [Vibrio owensii]MDA0382956.1 toprim domain-containing protein [Vibrio owensii]